MTWDSTDLDEIGNATEIALAARRTDDTLSSYTVMWVARVDTDLYIRSAYGANSAWYRRATRYGRGRLRAGHAEHEVVLHHLAEDDPVHDEIDAAYHAKYDRYGPRIVGSVVGPHAAEVTLRLDPASQLGAATDTTPGATAR